MQDERTSSAALQSLGLPSGGSAAVNPTFSRFATCKHIPAIKEWQPADRWADCAVSRHTV